MINIEIRKARKDYVCNYTESVISKGDLYQRVNLKGVGIFHFRISVCECTIMDKLVNDIFYDKYRGMYNSFEEEVWSSLPLQD